MKSEEEIRTKLDELQVIIEDEDGPESGFPYTEGYADALSWALGELD